MIVKGSDLVAEIAVFLEDEQLKCQGVWVFRTVGKAWTENILDQAARLVGKYSDMIHSMQVSVDDGVGPQMDHLEAYMWEWVKE